MARWHKKKGTGAPKKRARVRNPIPPPTIAQCLAFADEHVATCCMDQVEGRECVYRFVVPLKFCPRLNQFAEMHPHTRQGLKVRARKYIGPQIQFGRDEPFDKKVFIYACRFSSVRSDSDAAWTKIPLDRLTELRVIADDSDDSIDIVTDKMKAPPGKGFVYFEVWL